MDRGRTRKVPGRFRKASAYSISHVVVNLTGLEVHGATRDSNSPSLPLQGKLELSSRKFHRSGAVEESTEKVQKQALTYPCKCHQARCNQGKIRSSSGHFLVVSSIGGAVEESTEKVQKRALTPCQVIKRDAITRDSIIIGHFLVVSSIGGRSRKVPGRFKKASTYICLPSHRARCNHGEIRSSIAHFLVVSSIGGARRKYREGSGKQARTQLA